MTTLQAQKTPPSGYVDLDGTVHQFDKPFGAWLREQGFEDRFIDANQEQITDIAKKLHIREFGVKSVGGRSLVTATPADLDQIAASLVFVAIPFYGNAEPGQGPSDEIGSVRIMDAALKLLTLRAIRQPWCKLSPIIDGSGNITGFGVAIEERFANGGSHQ